MKRENFMEKLPEERALRQYIYSLGDRTDEAYYLIAAYDKAIRDDERKKCKIRNDMGIEIIPADNHAALNPPSLPGRGRSKG